MIEWLKIWIWSIKGESYHKTKRERIEIRPEYQLKIQKIIMKAKSQWI